MNDFFVQQKMFCVHSTRISYIQLKMESVFDVLLTCLDFYKHVGSSPCNYDNIVLSQVFTKIKRSKQTRVRQNSLRRNNLYLLV
jgi:hypothetical protein